MNQVYFLNIVKGLMIRNKKFYSLEPKNNKM